jgi:hypothetical protein
LETWNFKFHGCPTLPKVAKQIKTNYPYAKITLAALEKNSEIRNKLLEKRKHLHDIGLIFISTHGALVCERKSALPDGNHRNIYKCFSQFAKEWGIEDGLPTVESVLAKFAKKTGFTFNKTYIFSDNALLEIFNHIREKSAKSGLIKFNGAKKPLWNIDRLILSCCVNEDGVEIDCDTSKIYESILTRYPSIKICYGAVLRAQKALQNRNCK